MKILIFGICVVSTLLSLSSCSSTEDDSTANLPVCDCVELEPQRDGNGKRIKGREHIMYLQDSLYTGKCVTYHLDNTTKKVELIFQKGLLNGSQQVWDEEGNKILEAPMSQGQFHGTLKEWNDEQHLISKMEFEGNKVIGSGYYAYKYDKNYSSVRYKNNKFFYEIYSLEKPSLDQGYYYSTWFENSGSDFKGFGKDIGVIGDVRMETVLGSYTITDGRNWNESTPDMEEFNKILKEFHKNNPNEVLNIDKYSLGLYGGYIDVHGIVKYNESRPIPASFVNYCNSLKSLKFLKFHPDLDKLIEESKSKNSKSSS